ncbi:MAG: acyltransferase family protein [Syntrophobacteraceae bacterium]
MDAVYGNRTGTVKGQVPRQIGHFNPRIESLRGVASLCVLCSHCFGLLIVGGLKAYYLVPFFRQPLGAKVLTILCSLLNPEGAVVVFFLLSGYVLTLSFLRSPDSLPRQFVPYVVKRAFRLFPAMWVSILVIAAIRLALPDALPAPLRTTFYTRIFTTPITAGAIGKNFLLASFTINPLTWTMYVEAVCSLLVPLLVAITRTRKWAGFATLLILLALAARVHQLALHYLFCFQIGVVLASFPDLTARLRWPGTLFAGGLAILFLHRACMPTFTGNLLLVAAGATMILAAILCESPIDRFCWLDGPSVRFLGRISYSVYLVHLAVVYALVQVFVGFGLQNPGGCFPQVLLAVATIGVTTPLAWACYVGVEVPTLRYGKSIANVLALRLQRA